MATCKPSDIADQLPHDVILSLPMVLMRNLFPKVGLEVVSKKLSTSELLFSRILTNISRTNSTPQYSS